MCDFAHDWRGRKPVLNRDRRKRPIGALGYRDLCRWMIGSSIAASAAMPAAAAFSLIASKSWRRRLAGPLRDARSVQPSSRRCIARNHRNVRCG